MGFIKGFSLAMRTEACIVIVVEGDASMELRRWLRGEDHDLELIVKQAAVEPRNAMCETLGTRNWVPARCANRGGGESLIADPVL